MALAVKVHMQARLCESTTYCEGRGILNHSANKSRVFLSTLDVQSAKDSYRLNCCACVDEKGELWHHGCDNA